MAPPSYDPDRAPSVLYVGKATRGVWGEEEVSSGLRLKGTRLTPTDLEQYAANWLQQWIWSGTWRGAGPFWYFARSLSRTAANLGPVAISELQNLVWTNVAKLGSKNGNPVRDCLNLQRELAIETIKFEIRHYRPKLVFWVTGSYAEEVIDWVANDPDRTGWRKDLWDVSRCWWREANDGLPPMIWAYHPQGKKREVLQSWGNKARELMASH